MRYFSYYFCVLLLSFVTRIFFNILENRPFIIILFINKMSTLTVKKQNYFSFRVISYTILLFWFMYYFHIYIYRYIKDFSLNITQVTS